MTGEEGGTCQPEAFSHRALRFQGLFSISLVRPLQKEEKKNLLCRLLFLINDALWVDEGSLHKQSLFSN